MADGRTSRDLILFTEVPIIIGKRLKLIKFICSPNDFLEENGIVLDLTQKTCFFKDDPSNIFNFKTQEFTLNQFLIDIKFSLMMLQIFYMVRLTKFQQQ